MIDTEGGFYRGGFVCDTHKVIYYLDDDNNIVGIESERINNEKNIFGEKTRQILDGFIGNSILYSINNSKEKVSELLKDINIVYLSRIKKFKNNK